MTAPPTTPDRTRSEHPQGHMQAGLSANASTAEETAVRQGSRVAGISLLVLAALSAFGVFVATRRLVTEGDATRTASDIAGSEGLFRAGILSLCVVVVLDVVVAASLYRLLRPVSETWARVMGLLRLVYAAGFLVAIAELLGAVSLVGGEPRLAEAADRDVAVLLHMEAFDDAWQAALLIFGIHLVLLGYLASRSGYVPRVVGLLVAGAGVGYVIDSCGTILSGEVWNVSSVTFVGEAVLAVWLLASGRRIVLGTTGQVSPPLDREPYASFGEA